LSTERPITILGTGSWGTALAIQISRGQHAVRLWGRDSFVSEMVKTRRNEYYLPDIVLSDLIEVMTDFDTAVQDVQDILIVVPSHAFRSILTQLHAIRPSGVRIAWGTKGLDADHNQLLHEVVREIYGQDVPLAIIAGPSFAKEVALGSPTAVTLTSNDASFAQALTSRLHGNHFRVYSQTDFIGVQVCGAVKNCLAVATGLSDGLGYGANARSALITRGLNEMTRLGLAMGGQQQTFMGLAGLGDLVLTCTDDQSRNRRFGYALGTGVDIAEAERSVGQVVEGRTNAFKVLELAHRYNVEMPIINQICQVLSGKVTPFESVETFFAREQKPESLF
jgi:glycerol-3-phosphate dehydrogenase (NAD(P)+)